MSYVEFKSTFPKTRKDHNCEWCNELIPKGLKCFYRSYMWEGEFNHGYMHLECYESMSATHSEDLMNGWTPGDFLRGSNEAR